MKNENTMLQTLRPASSMVAIDKHISVETIPGTAIEVLTSPSKDYPLFMYLKTDNFVIGDYEGFINQTIAEQVFGNTSDPNLSYSYNFKIHEIKEFLEKAGDNIELLWDLFEFVDKQTSLSRSQAIRLILDLTDDNTYSFEYVISVLSSATNNEILLLKKAPDILSLMSIFREKF